MPEKTPTLNRFSLFGLFAYRAAKKSGYPDEDARLLGFSTALLYAIFKAKSQAKKDKPEKERKELPKEIEAKTKTVEFGGQQFTVIPGKGKRLRQWATGNPLIEKVCLEVFTTNADAIRLYRKLGFVEEGLRLKDIKVGPGRHVNTLAMGRFVK